MITWKNGLPIVALVSLGVMAVAASWRSYNSSFDPVGLGIGCAALTGAFLLYKKATSAH